MKVEMLMPQMGESIAEATVIRWHKSIGDFVKRDETILEISTDKVDSEIPSPEAGILKEIKAEEGQTVAVNSVIAILDTEASKGDSPTVIETTAEKAPVKEEKVIQINPEQSSSDNTSASSHESSYSRTYSPLVKNIASQHGLSR